MLCAYFVIFALVAAYAQVGRMPATLMTSAYLSYLGHADRRQILLCHEYLTHVQMINLRRMRQSAVVSTTAALCLCMCP